MSQLIPVLLMTSPTSRSVPQKTRPDNISKTNLRKPHWQHCVKHAPEDVIFGGAFDSAKSHKRQRRKRQSVTAKREKSQTLKFV